jgi:cation transport ATPase
MSTPRDLSVAIEGMIYASCVGRMSRDLAALKGVGKFSVNLASETGPDIEPDQRGNSSLL